MKTKIETKSAPDSPPLPRVQFLSILSQRSSLPLLPFLTSSSSVNSYPSHSITILVSLTSHFLSAGSHRGSLDSSASGMIRTPYFCVFNSLSILNLILAFECTLYFFVGGFVKEGVETHFLISVFNDFMSFVLVLF